MRSHFIEVDLNDTLVFRKSINYKLTVEGNPNLKSDETNLITKAYRLAQNYASTRSTEYSIHLLKKIPIGGGLGGGSSNAAQTLKVLSQKWNIDWSNYDLERQGKKIGADVPFFIQGGFQFVEGLGDVLIQEDSNIIKGLIFVLIVPPIKVSTKEAFKKLNKGLEADQKHYKFSALKLPIKWQLLYNDFEKNICETYPEIVAIKQGLYKANALYAGLSGSGSTVFGVFDNLMKAKSVLKIFPQYKTFLTSPIKK